MTPRITLISLDDTQRRLGGLSRSATERLVQSGELRTIKIGRRVRVIEQSLDDYIDRLLRLDQASAPDSRDEYADVDWSTLPPGAETITRYGCDPSSEHWPEVWEALREYTRPDLLALAEFHRARKQNLGVLEQAALRASDQTGVTDSDHTAHQGEGLHLDQHAP